MNLLVVGPWSSRGCEPTEFFDLKERNGAPRQCKVQKEGMPEDTAAWSKPHKIAVWIGTDENIWAKAKIESRFLDAFHDNDNVIMFCSFLVSFVAQMF